jgi:hypothetical protein
MTGHSEAFVCYGGQFYAGQSYIWILICLLTLPEVFAKKPLQKNFAKKPGWLLAKNVIFSGCQMATLIAT